VELHMLQKYIQ